MRTNSCDPGHGNPGRGDPAWAGWLAGLLAYLCLGRPAWSPPELARADVERWAPRDEPSRMAVRDLRRLPGVGDRRAAAAAEARWRHDPATGELAWSDVAGIGAITAARVEAWLRARELGTGLAHPGAGTAAPSSPPEGAATTEPPPRAPPAARARSAPPPGSFGAAGPRPVAAPPTRP